MLGVNCVFNFSVQASFETFLDLIYFQRITLEVRVEVIVGRDVKCSLLLSDLTNIGTCPQILITPPQYQIAWESVQQLSSCYMRTGIAKLMSAFLQRLVPYTPKMSFAIIERKNKLTCYRFCLFKNSKTTVCCSVVTKRTASVWYGIKARVFRADVARDARIMLNLSC
jgi:hypothetical protein